MKNDSEKAGLDRAVSPDEQSWPARGKQSRGAIHMLGSSRKANRRLPRLAVLLWATALAPMLPTLVESARAEGTAVSAPGPTAKKVVKVAPKPGTPQPAAAGTTGTKSAGAAKANANSGATSASANKPAPASADAVEVEVPHSANFVPASERPRLDAERAARLVSDQIATRIARARAEKLAAKSGGASGSTAAVADAKPAADDSAVKSEIVALTAEKNAALERATAEGVAKERAIAEARTQVAAESDARLRAERAAVLAQGETAKLTAEKSAALEALRTATQAKSEGVSRERAALDAKEAADRAALEAKATAAKLAVEKRQLEEKVTVQSRAKSEAEAKAKSESDARLVAEKRAADARAAADRAAADKAAADALIAAERAQIDAKVAQATTQAKLDIATKAQALAKAEAARTAAERALADAEARAAAEKREKLEAKAAAKLAAERAAQLEQARAEVQTKIVAEAKARVQAEQAAIKAKAEASKLAAQAAQAEKRAQAEADAKAKAAKEAEKLAIAKADAESRAKFEADARAKAEADARTKAEAESRARAEARQLAAEKAEIEAKAKAEQAKLARAAAEAESRAKAEQAKLARAAAEAESRAKAEAATKAKADARAKAEAEAALRAEAAAKIKAEAALRIEMAAKAKAESRARAEAEAIARAESRAKAEADAKADAELAAKTRAEARAKAAAEAAERAEAKAAAAAQAKADLLAQRDELEAKAKAEQAKLVAAKANAEARSKLEAEARAKAEREAAEARAYAAKLNVEKAEAEARLKSESEARLKAEARAKTRITTEVAAATPEHVNTTSSAPESRSASAKTQKAVGRTQVAKVDFSDYGDHSEVLIRLSGSSEYVVVPSNRMRAVIRLSGVELPRELEQTLDTSDYASPVKSISTFRDPESPQDVRVVIELGGDVRREVKKSGNTLIVSFDKPAGSEWISRAGGARNPRVASYDATRLAPFTDDSASAGVSTTRTTKRAVGSRKRVDLNFKDADIHDVLRIMSTVVGVDIVVPDDVKATVTVKMTDVLWSDALDVILKSKGFEWAQRGRLVRVMTKEQAAAERTLAEEEAAKRKIEEPVEPQIFTLNYARATDLLDNINELRSSRGRVAVDERTNSIIVTDVASTRNAIRDLLSYLDTQTPQVLIEARVVEARSTFVRELGVQWGGNFSASSDTGNGTGLVFPSSLGISGGSPSTNFNGVPVNPNFAVNLPANVVQGSGGAVGFTLGSVGGNFNINLRLSALEDTGTVRIVSAPKITTLDNQEATISQGVSIPIQVTGPQGTQTQFVPADLELKVTPHVTRADCSVVMDINVQKNEADFQNRGAGGDPSILRKTAHTNMIVRDGDTAVIGGIYTRQTGHSFKRIPWFAELPFIGYFFRNELTRDDRTEVLIFITPRITNRAYLQCTDDRGPARKKVQ